MVNGRTEAASWNFGGKQMTGIGPERTAAQNPDGTWLLTLTPPAWSGWSASQITLTDEQYNRYQRWLANRTSARAMFPDLTPSQQEQLVSGISPEEWDAEFGDDE